MEIKVFRYDFGKDYTDSTVVIDGQNFGYCLEDTVREDGCKIKGETAIPAGKYEVRLTMSTRFKRITPQLIDVPDFEGIRIHGGNSSLDTEGCLLIASTHLSAGKVFGTLESRITAMIGVDSKKGSKSYITIYNCK